MSSREVTERWMMDADIIINYQARVVTFDKPESMKSWGFLFTLFTFPFILSMGTTELIIAYDWLIHGNLSQNASGILTSGFIGSFVFLGFILLRVFIPQFSITRNLMFRFKKPIAIMSIPNPQGVIEILTRRSEPFFDLEFDGDIASKLMTVSLIKEAKIPKKHFQHRKTKLTICLNGLTNGVLTIKEYP